MGSRTVVGAGLWILSRPVVLCVVLAVLGSLMVVTGVLGLRSSSDDLARVRELRSGGGTVVTGTFVGSDPDMGITEQGRQRRLEHCPRYAYTAADGVERTIVDGDACERIERPIPREPVRVLVDDDDPSTAFIDEDGAAVGRTSSLVFASAQTLGGLVALSAAVVVLIRRRRRSRGARAA